MRSGRTPDSRDGLRAGGHDGSKGSGSRGWRKRRGPLGGTAKEPGVGAERMEGGGGFGATGRDPRQAGLITHPSRSLPSCDSPSEGARDAGSSCRRASSRPRAALVGFPEAPGRRSVAGSVSALPGGESLAGGTLKFTHSFRERVVSTYSVPCAVLGAQRGLRQPRPAFLGRTGQGDLHSDPLVPSVFA